MKPAKKVIMVLASVCLIAVGVTFAYISSVTETATNTFSSNRKITLKLREPTWDGYDFKDNYPDGKVPGTVAKTDDADLGINVAMNYYPGDSINKNPKIQNTSPGGEGEYVAIKVEYYNGTTQISRSKFMELYGKTATNGNDVNKDGINDNFVKISTDNDTHDLYAYGTAVNNLTVLQKNIQTSTLFDQVILNTDIKTDSNGKWPDFQIKVTGYAVQSNNISYQEAISTLHALAKEN